MQIMLTHTHKYIYIWHKVESNIYNERKICCQLLLKAIFMKNSIGNEFTKINGVWEMNMLITLLWQVFYNFISVHEISLSLPTSSV